MIARPAGSVVVVDVVVVCGRAVVVDVVVVLVVVAVVARAHATPMSASANATREKWLVIEAPVQVEGEFGVRSSQLAARSSQPSASFDPSHHRLQRRIAPREQLRAAKWDGFIWDDAAPFDAAAI